MTDSDEPTPTTTSDAVPRSEPASTRRARRIALWALTGGIIVLAVLTLLLWWAFGPGGIFRGTIGLAGSFAAQAPISLGWQSTLEESTFDA
jgi:hypothetical protein